MVYMADESSVNSEVSKKISSQFGLNQTGNDEQWMQLFIDKINYLINHDFDQLIQLLYRIDVDETKLKTALRNTQRDAAEVIAEMIIEREKVKWKLKNKL